MRQPGIAGAGEQGIRCFCLAYPLPQWSGADAGRFQILRRRFRLPKAGWARNGIVAEQRRRVVARGDGEDELVEMAAPGGRSRDVQRLRQGGCGRHPAVGDFRMPMQCGQRVKSSGRKRAQEEAGGVDGGRGFPFAQEGLRAEMKSHRGCLCFGKAVP